MAKAIYERWSCDGTYDLVYTSSGVGTYFFPYETHRLYKSYTFQPFRGIINTTDLCTNQNRASIGAEVYGTSFSDDLSKVIVTNGNAFDGNGVAGVLGTMTGYNRNLISTQKGTHLTDIIADYGSLPTDGRHTDGYWYVFIKMASDLKANVGGIWRDAPTAYVNVGGIMRPQSELKANVNGIWR